MKDSSSQGHHHLIYRLKRKIWHHRRLIPIAFFVFAVLVGLAVGIVYVQNKQAQMQLSAQNQVNVGSGYRDITYQGQQYRYNNRISTILFAGVDSEEPLVSNVRFTVAPRADSISLIVLDEYHHRITLIALSRDTMTKIRRYTLSGRDRGLFTDHLGYAYTYGDGGEASCDNLCEAVSQLLYSVPVNEYIVTNRAALPLLGSIVGPVNVVVPNDDLAVVDPSFSAGNLVTIDASNLEFFIRSRDTEMDLSNVGRMERQKTYINAAIEQIRSLFETNPSEMWNTVETAEKSLITNITRSRYLDLLRILKNTAYDHDDYYTPEGSQVVGAEHDEFYPDEAALLSKVIDIFYIKK
jgi:anionic cell wall polymer biosynthesis LytR-Cps2A-Psr (LCP) family protein